ncbi:hypothetical protein SUGI_0914780 [Cryptomeria japonica]|nr:hypothetical protein SUGI_0914780 [Cryptomeria japonica]
MDAFQLVAAAAGLVSNIIGAVRALEQASRDLEDAPKKVQALEELITNLEGLIRDAKRKYYHKLHNPQLESQIQSFSTLLERVQPKVKLAKKVSSRKGIRHLANIVLSSVVGDSLAKVARSIRDDLNWWLESQELTIHVQKVIDSAASGLPAMLRVRSESGYPVSKKCELVRTLLDKDDSPPVVLIVGLSGIGKTCLARQVASEPPERFLHGAVELTFGQWCSRLACGGNKLQDALIGKSILILLDDVWEPDIIDRFAKLYDNDCKYLATTRNEAVHEITEALKVEICKDDTVEVSKAILLYHSQMSDTELPDVAESLLNRCGHHPLTVAVIGKALRKENRSEKWEKAVSNLQTFATYAPVPVPYLNEKEAENAATIYGSFEFSLEAMASHSRDLFIAFAALSWAEPVPEICLEAVWSALGQDSNFLLVANKLIEGSLLTKGSLLTRAETHEMYHLHDMVSLYLDNKVHDALKMLLIDARPEASAAVAPWLFVFGKEKVKKVAEQKLKGYLRSVHEKQVVVTLEAIYQALLASKSVTELETSSANFRSLVGPGIVELISIGSQDLQAAVARSMANFFSEDDYMQYMESIENMDVIEKLTELLETCNNPVVQTEVATVLARVAEFGREDMANEILNKIPMTILVDLLDPDFEELHDNVLRIFMSLAKAGKEKAVQKIFMAGMERKLIGLLENGSEVAQHRTVVTLKSFYELGGSDLVHGFLSSGIMENLPWHARLSLEKLTISERLVPSLQEKEAVEELVSNILNRETKIAIKAMQDLVPIVEKADSPKIRDMILQTVLIENLAEQLQHRLPEKNRLKSEAIFLLMKLGCSGGESCIRKILKFNIVEDLFLVMSCKFPELQDAAYMAVHQLLLGAGRNLIVDRILKTRQIEKLVQLLESKSLKTNEISMHCLEDLVELGGKACIERMLALKVVEKLAILEKDNIQLKGSVMNFVKGIDKCEYLSVAERQVSKQQILRKVKTVLKDTDLVTHMIGGLENTYGGDGSSWKNRRKN